MIYIWMENKKNSELKLSENKVDESFVNLLVEMS